MTLNKAILLVIDGMDTVNFTMANTPVMQGLHGRTAVGVAHTEVIGAGAAITPIAHAMMGTGASVVAHRPGFETHGRAYDYFGRAVETIGHVAREAGMATAAVGKNEAAIVLGGTDLIDFSRLEKDGVDAYDHRKVAREALCLLERMEKGVLVVNYGGVDQAGHHKDLNKIIASVEKADAIVAQLMAQVDLKETLVVIAADHGTNAITGNHNTAPTPLCLITERIKGRVNLGVVHNMEIARTITSALGLRAPDQALGRDLLQMALGEGGVMNYQEEMERQLERYYQTSGPRHQVQAPTKGS